MKRTTKASLAAGAATVLLVGGLGTMALWSDTADFTGNKGITTGELSLGDVAMAWDQNTLPSIWVPGDSATGELTVPIEASGDNLKVKATLTAADGPNALPEAFSFDWETATIDGNPVTVGPDGVIDLGDTLNGKTSELEATVRVTFDADATTGQNTSFDLAEQGAVKVEQYR